MTINDREVRRYLRRTKKLLPCERKLKGQIMSRLREQVSEFLAQNPQADMADLTAKFGSPLEIAATCVENTDTFEILKCLHARKRVVTITAATAIAMLLSWAAVLTIEVIRVSRTSIDAHITGEYGLTEIKTQE